MSWRDFVMKNNPLLSDPPHSPPPAPSREEDEADVARYHQDVELALDLLEKILHPMCTQRLTARDALYHPFLFEESSTDDDNCPHPLGEGVCSSLHFQDSVTEEHCVRIYERDGLKVQKVHSGLGIAIGNSPCVFHSNLSEQERFREIDERRIEAEEDEPAMIDLDDSDEEPS